jgi:hypothetical protein
LTTNDAAELLGVADQVVIVARGGRTTHEAADRAAELLERRQANAVGAVIMGADEGLSGRYYYYYRGRYYHDGTTKTSKQPDVDLESLAGDMTATERDPNRAAHRGS